MRGRKRSSKSPFSPNSLSDGQIALNLATSGIDAAATQKTNRALFFLAQRGAVDGDSMKQQALLRTASRAGRHSARCSKEAVEARSRSLRMSTGDRRQHFGPQTGGPSALMAAMGWTLLAGPHDGRASLQE